MKHAGRSNLPKADAGHEPAVSAIDFRAADVGKRRRKPLRGTVVTCPECGARGLLRVYAWRRGRYQASVVHVAHVQDNGFPVVDESCSVRATVLGQVRRWLPVVTSA